MQYKILWTDMHSNIHHEQMDQLTTWFDHVKEVIDFWPIAYYPYFNQVYNDKLTVENLHEEAEINKDWETIRAFSEKANAEGFAMFMGYEWQGSGNDGDHNVFFKDNKQAMTFPLSYRELYENYKKTDAIAIPHHPAYQLNYRGKNWSTHIDAFSPFVEIYSSHGCSENDQISLTMNRHIHMGPRTSKTSGQKGYDLGFRYGLIASGDNHHVPAIAKNGSMACLAESNSKEDLWNAMINRRVYGVSSERIQLDFTINDAVMGSIINADGMADMKLNVVGSNAIDRIELIADNRVIEIIGNTKQPLKKDIVRFKFKLECGWGPNRKFFPEYDTKIWDGKLSTNGKLISVERCFNSFNQKVLKQNKKECFFHLETHKSAKDGGWMGVDGIETEGLIFEIESAIDDVITLELNDRDYELKVSELLEDSCLYPLMDEVKELLDQRYQLKDYYRKDAWWHNSYKFKTSQAAHDYEYQMSIRRELDVSQFSNLRVRVWQKNGCCAWSSPIFFNSKEQ